VTRPSLRALAVLTLLSLLSLAATCQSHTPKRDVVLNLRVLTRSVSAIQAGETALYNAHTVPALTIERHRAFNAKIVEVVDLVSAAADVVDLWHPGDPLPAQLGPILLKTRSLVEEASQLVGKELPKEVADLWSALTQIILILGGVL
jgi:hypothetical protein